MMRRVRPTIRRGGLHPDDDAHDDREQHEVGREVQAEIREAVEGDGNRRADVARVQVRQGRV